MEDTDTIITISDVLEYLFCPRFTYFMYCLDIPQHEEQRFKVLKGREVHETRRMTNAEYVRKKLKCIKKERSVFIASRKNHIKGIVDEVLLLEDSTAAPLEYKYAEFKDKIFKTYRYQLVLHGMMIRENYGMEVNKGYICYIRSNNQVKQVDFKPSDFQKGIEIIKSIINIINKGLYPKTTKNLRKCVDCCYRNICV